MKFYKMHIYCLKRSFKIDKRGRPVIFLNYFGYQSLVWCGTTNKNNKAIDKPLVLNFNDRITYFYNCNIEKVPSNKLLAQWKNNDKNKPYILKSHERNILVIKLISKTNQEWF